MPVQRIENVIHHIRGQRVMLDRDLASLYGVEVRILNQAVKRNTERFPEDFTFQLAREESDQVLRSQIVILKEQKSGFSVETSKNSRSQIVTLKQVAHRKYLPFVFEQGVAMLSSVLRSPRAVQVNIEIMRTFVRLRQWLTSNAELAKRLADLEQKYDKNFKVVFEAIRELMRESARPKRKREIGFHTLKSARAAGA
ncbi:MAG TPA: ORF6N domain-containing protein [Verrucomicrobiae bacterium]|nr:ORF6N domain-containing protein [Verrucomicrobiae bacterium]